MAKKKDSKENHSKGTFTRLIQSPKTTVGIFALAAVLLGYGGVGVAQAIPTIRSDLYGAEMSMEHIGVALIENDDLENPVSQRTYTANQAGPIGPVNGTLLTKFSEKIIPGKTYNETLSVLNTGTIDQFVRVTVRKYWKDASGNEIHSKELHPNKIHLEFREDGEWQIDDTATTDERTVLYRLRALAPNAHSNYFLTAFTIDQMLGDVIQTETDGPKGKIITTEYKYNGYSFVIEATVDAVQTHNAEAAIMSAWGRSVTVSENNTVIALDE